MASDSSSRLNLREVFVLLVLLVLGFKYGSAQRSIERTNPSLFVAADWPETSFMAANASASRMKTYVE